MPSSDYASAIGGGLKLKGAKDAGVSKKKKPKKKSKLSESKSGQDDDATAASGAPETEQSALQKVPADADQEDGGSAIQETEVKEYGKTEAQRRFEESRKKRLDERLKREGVLTHKERVQQLNKYLSGLSEHHDMPRIGPG